MKQPDFKCDFWVCKLHSIPITGGVLDKQHEQKFIKKEPLLWFFRVKNFCCCQPMPDRRWYYNGFQVSSILDTSLLPVRLHYNSSSRSESCLYSIVSFQKKSNVKRRSNPNFVTKQDLFKFRVLSIF